MISVNKVVNQEELDQAFRIREEVFVHEQKVSPEEEYDQYEKTSTHFIAYDAEGRACGTARWRQTDKGIKLERFAVLKPFRKTGIGRLLLQTMLRDIEEDPNVEQQKIYMHAQTHAVDFYRKFGFETVGEEFDECGIMHYQMMR
ncbi:MAG: GNAT family N-acetyltransferase [Cyclobacteriaceae bacterium]